MRDVHIEAATPLSGLFLTRKEGIRRLNIGAPNAGVEARVVRGIAAAQIQHELTVRVAESLE